MDNCLIIERLKEAGMCFGPGLSAAEIKKIEEFFGFRFPKEIADFFSCAYPLGGGFFDYRDTSQRNKDRFLDFQKDITETFLFDIEHNTDSVRAMLHEYLGDIQDINEFTKAVVRSIESSPKLIPFYSHRCFFDGLDGMPIISFWQAVDTIIYGYDLENYLEAEFLGIPRDNVVTDGFYDLIDEKLKTAGIWYYTIG